MEQALSTAKLFDGYHSINPVYQDILKVTLKMKINADYPAVTAQSKT